MTKREIAILSFKVLSIYTFIQAIDKSYYILYYLIYKNQLDVGRRLNLVMTSVPPLLLALCGVILWYTSPLLATSIFKSTTPEDGSQASLVSIQIAAFSVVGLFILATGLPNLVDMTVVILTAGSIQGGAGAMIHDIVVLVLKVALGLWLLLGSHGLVKFIRSMQRD
jgi:hypothetical protein